MRVLDPKTAEDRKRKLLQAVIYQFMRTGKPVGSQVIVDKYNFGLSSATVRNMLVDLEKEGFLIQPHTSAGRVPSDKGLSLLRGFAPGSPEPGGGGRRRIRKEYSARTKELEDLMVSTSRMLSTLSSYTGHGAFAALGQESAAPAAADSFKRQPDFGGRGVPDGTHPPSRGPVEPTAIAPRALAPSFPICSMSG